ncbi:MAG: hypothetical protein WC589_23655 [Sphingobacterium sp.]
MNTKILDCTVRDGGHLNNWSFDPLCVKASYFAALKSGADYFEIGYRMPKSKKGLGLFGYSHDDVLSSLVKPSDKCKLTVMIDAGKSDNSLFKQCKPDVTPIKAVRVAAYPYELQKAISLVEDIKDKGYEVFLNLMASSELNDEQYNQLRGWSNKVILNSINFADSFGSFLPTDISNHIQKLHDIGFKYVGFHSHNNLQLAFANTLRAMEEGVAYVDASIYGMGRGAGNLPIEVLIGYLEKSGFEEYNVSPYLDVIERYYQKISEELDWGYKIKSLMSGMKEVHPYYVDDLYNKNIYTVDEIWNALDFVKGTCPISYSADKLNEALDSRLYRPLTPDKIEDVCQEISQQFKIIPASDAFEIGNLQLSKKHYGKKIMIIANGPSVLQYKEEIEALLNKEQCITIGVNYLQGEFIPDYHIFVNRKRFLKYISSVNSESILIVPSFFGKEIVSENHTGQCQYFDIETVHDLQENPIRGATQRLVNLNVAVCAILMAYQMGASEIYAVGMDGYIKETSEKIVYFYNEDDLVDDENVAAYRYKKLTEELNRINLFLQDHNVPFSIITPTSHKKYYQAVLINEN